jgi:hypothetical protein
MNHRLALRTAFSLCLAVVVPAALAASTAGCSKKAAFTKGGTAKDKTGGTAKADQSMANMQGPSYMGSTCDGAAEGDGFCASDSSIVFCAGGNWFLLDCSQIDGFPSCGEDDSGDVDCFPASDF